MAKKGKKAPQMEGGVLVAAVNKKARRDYEVLEKFEAGLSLLGSEVKSVREGGVNLKESYVREKQGELFLVQCHISPYAHSPVDAHNPTRERKLLMKRSEIDRLIGKVKEKGLSLVPLRLYFKRGRLKLELATGRGKKLYDKRRDEKSRAADRTIQAKLKHSG